VNESVLIPVSVAMTADLAYRARVRAAIEGKSRSQLVRELLMEALGTPKAANQCAAEQGVPNERC